MQKHFIYLGMASMALLISACQTVTHHQKQHVDVIGMESHQNQHTNAIGMENPDGVYLPSLKKTRLVQKQAIAVEK